MVPLQRHLLISMGLPIELREGEGAEVEVKDLETMWDIGLWERIRDESVGEMEEAISVGCTRQ